MKLKFIKMKLNKVENKNYFLDKVFSWDFLSFSPYPSSNNSHQIILNQIIIPESYNPSCYKMKNYIKNILNYSNKLKLIPQILQYNSNLRLCTLFFLIRMYVQISLS